MFDFLDMPGEREGGTKLTVIISKCVEMEVSVVTI